MIKAITLFVALVCFCIGLAFSITRPPSLREILDENKNDE